jgi:scyllo-inositol 2-dehydrogenase (NADP+)
VKSPELRYKIKGTKGNFIKYGIDPQEAKLKEGLMPSGENWGKEDKAYWGELIFSSGKYPLKSYVETVHGNYMGFYDNVYQVLTMGKEMLVKPEEARDVIRAIELAFESNLHKETIDFN